MTRFFLPVLLLVLLFNSVAFAQAEIARQRFELGLTNANKGRYEQAVMDLLNALEKYKFASDFDDEFAAKINYNIGVCYYRSGRAREAVAFLEAAVKLSKNKNPKALHALGIIQSELGNRQAAKNSFALAVRLNKRDGESWFDLAMIYLEENDLRGATDCFQKAIRNRSIDAATAFNNLGVITAMNGDWLAAEKQFEKALTMSGGKLPEAMRNLNLCRSQNFSRDMAAKLEFVNKKIRENPKGDGRKWTTINKRT